MIWPCRSLPLLFPERSEYCFDRFFPLFIKWSRIPADFPVFMGKPDGITQGIDLPFPLVNARLHIRDVRLFPFTQFGFVFIKRICIWIQENAPGLPVDHTRYQLLQFFIFLYY